MGGKLSKQELTTALTANDNDTANISFLTKADEDAALELFADAFQQDPMFRWVAGLDDDDPNNDEKMKVLCRYMTGWVNNKIFSSRRGTALGIRDEYDSKALIGFMSVVPASCAKDRMIDDVLSVLKYGPPPMYKDSSRYGLHSKKRLEVLGEVPKARMRHMGRTDRWIYLQTLCVASAHQHGKGYGSKLLRSLNQVADSLGVSIYLETESSELESMYKHFGFSTLEELTLCVKGDESKDASHIMYLMRRDPVLKSDNELK